MIFKTIPQNGASWHSPVLYTLEFDKREEQVAVDIYDQLHAEILGRVMLYNVESAEIDIAPYIRSSMMKKGHLEQTAIIKESKDVCRIVLMVGGARSEPRLLFRSDISAMKPRIMSAVTQSGTVAQGEVIWLTAYANDTIRLFVEQSSNGGVKEYVYRSSGAPCEIAVPIDNAAKGDVITIRVVCDDKPEELCQYRVVERDDSAVRLVWIDPVGALESYTFPQSVKRTISIKSEDVEGESGWYRRVVSTSVVRRLMMAGATQEEVDRVLTALLSPAVYRCDGRDSRAIHLITEGVTYDDHGKLRRLEFDIKEEWKGGEQR